MWYYNKCSALAATAQGPDGRTFAWDKMLYVTRGEWQAEKPRLKKAMKTPVGHVIFTYTNSPTCYTKTECKKKVKQIQTCCLHACYEHDIKFNFLIGGDGRVYEGRGWFTCGPIISEGKPLAPLSHKSIEIAFICRDNERPSEEMAEAAAALINKGIEEQLLKEDVKVTTLWKAYTIPKEVIDIPNVRVSRHVYENS